MENTYTHTKKSPDFINKQMDKGSLKKLLGQMYLEYGGAKAASLADALKHLGYKYATVSGTTISIADLSVPSIKKDLLKSAEEEIEKSTNRYLKGEITEVERYTKVIDTWSETTAKLTEQVVENFDKFYEIEKITKHDIKAVEYYVKSIIENSNFYVSKSKSEQSKILSFIHFGLTSQDIVSLSTNLLFSHISYKLISVSGRMNLTGFLDPRHCSGKSS